MEFWGVEVKSGKPLNVQPGEGMVIHLSQASIGEVKANKNEAVTLSVNVDGKKLVLATLMTEKLPQQLFDLVFDRNFELSHNSKSGSIYFFGYRAANPIEDDEGLESDDSEEEDIPLVQSNGKPEIKAAKAGKPVVAEKAKESKDSAVAKQKVKIVEPTKDEDDDDSEDDDSDEDASSDGDLMDEDDSDSENEDSDDEDDTPKKEAPPSKKRGPDSAIKTPASQKKAKLATPQKTDDKKSSGHVATPYPSKHAGKTPASKATQQSPKSGGSHSCGPCKKTFNSEVGLQSHTKAKHSAGK